MSVTQNLPFSSFMSSAIQEMMGETMSHASSMPATRAVPVGSDEAVMSPDERHSLELLATTVQIFIFAKRLPRSFALSSEKLTPIKGKDAYEFNSSRGDGRRVFGSRVGEYVLVNILLQSTEHLRLPIRDVHAVKAISLLGAEKIDLWSTAAEVTPVLWIVAAVLDPATLTRLADDARLPDTGSDRKKSDFDFDLRVIVTPDSNHPMIALCQSVSWRLIRHYSPMIGQFLRRCTVKGLRPLPQVWRSMARCMK